MFANFFEFGEKTAKEIIRMLFFVGMVPIAFYAIVIGRIAALAFLTERWVPSSYGMYTSVMETNYLLGFLTAVIVFIVGIILWKLICELILLIFRSLEVYIQKNSNPE
ncbi:hypothetical protein [Brevibacillus sp. SIMBA_040]|uniref:hypothetical protein n=1 Tax=unclassified Brevibacillus TaxID=2684853 RepID=UPI00397E221C